MSTVDSAERRRIVVRERLRFARDLHDLLGPRLSAITLQCELAQRLMDRKPETARTELAQALSGIRQVLAEVREVAHGYHCLSLESEAASAGALLRSAGVRAEIRLGPGPLPAPEQTVLATVVREATANVLRHSRARHCRVAAETIDDTIRLTVVNDGAEPSSSPADSTDSASSASSAAGELPAGMGLRSLTERVEAVGGRLVHGPVPSGRYRLEVLLPLPTARRAATADAEDGVGGMDGVPKDSRAEHAEDTEHGEDRPPHGRCLRS
ncbi:sensor histidine kinase [Streptomyces jumonjinensis]|uniref:sensor histidine kinase n=1 Tax=Streptomyces jumonjinensis TaxID=1945 RepID=UPI0037972F93